MFEAEAITFLESGCALIVGTVAADGEPYATRGWGLTVTDRNDQQIRLLLDADDEIGRANLVTTGAIAITGTEVPTLRSMQLKGQALDLSPADDNDRARAERFVNEFYADVERTDGVLRELFDRIVPEDFVVCTVNISDVFDQTPGPAAGSPIPTAQP